jgi:hypothetical protein
MYSEMFYFITLFFANFFGWMDCDDTFVLTMAGPICSLSSSQIIIRALISSAVWRGILFSVFYNHHEWIEYPPDMGQHR